MQTEVEIRETIAKVRKAIDADEYCPVCDGSRLQEHLYFLRLGMIDALEDVLLQTERDEE